MIDPASGKIVGKPIWFDDEQDMKSHVKFIKACPLTDDKGKDIGFAKVKITEYSAVKTKVI